MRLYAVVAPPLQEVNRLLGRVASPEDPCLDWDSSTSINVGLAFFGNMVLSDVDRLVKRLAVEIARTAPLTLRFAGGTALETEGDDSVWVTVDGDTSELRALAMSIAAVARTDGFAVDRRWYKPHARIARINDATTLTSLQRTLSLLEAYDGSSWSPTTVTLIEVKAVGDLSAPGGTAVFGSLPLGA
ncbi:MAG TPA: 2'-5' RNA ligase family protein [Actinomycetales bacterium]|jgi:2'-5' RNA ligase|nr:2'-5' RNA ligase family protein [Actinomycetales bacterium]